MTVLLPLWAQSSLLTRNFSYFLGYQKLFTAILFSKLVHHRVLHKMSISEMLFWFKNTTPQAKCPLCSRHVGNRTVERSEVTKLEKIYSYCSIQYSGQKSKMCEFALACLCYKQIVQHGRSRLNTN